MLLSQFRGKEVGTETYSRVVSGMRFYEAENSILFTPGGVGELGIAIGKVVEVDVDTKEILFEATVTAKQIAFHNVNRMDLYPE